MQNTDNVIENIDDSVRKIGTLAGIEPSGVTADPANTDFFIENIDENVKAIAETLDVTPSEVTADPANTDFFVENIAKNVDLIKDNFSGGGGDVTIESLTVTQNGTYEEEGKAYTPVVVNVPVPELTISPTKITLSGISGDVAVKPQVNVDISSTLTSMEQMFNQDTNITSISFDSSIDLSNVESCHNICYGCTRLTQISFNNTFKPLRLSGSFNGCSNLASAPQMDTSRCTNVTQMFQNCNIIQYPYVYNLANVTNQYNHQYAFQGGIGQLTQTSVDNMLQSIITLGVTENKKLTFCCGSNASSNTNLITKVQASPYYQSFLDAGWTIS